MDNTDPSSWAIVDEIAAAYRLGRHALAVAKAKQALQTPERLTPHHKEFLQQVLKQLEQQLEQQVVTKSNAPQLGPLWAELQEAYRARNRELLLTRLEQIEQMETLTDPEKRSFSVWHGLARAMDPDYQAPHYPKFDEYATLRQISLMACEAGDVSQGLNYAWYFSQYCAFGTIAFHDSLAHLTNCAARLRDMDLARYAAEMYLNHHDLLRRAALHPETPVSLNEPSIEHFWEDGRHLQAFSFPIEAARIGIAQDGANCWVRILELAVSTMPISWQPEEYEESLKALKEHYERIEDRESLERLQRDHPRSE